MICIAMYHRKIPTNPQTWAKYQMHLVICYQIIWSMISCIMYLLYTLKQRSGISDIFTCNYKTFYLYGLDIDQSVYSQDINLFYQFQIAQCLYFYVTHFVSHIHLIFCQYSNVISPVGFNSVEYIRLTHQNKKKLSWLLMGAKSSPVSTVGS